MKVGKKKVYTRVIAEYRCVDQEKFVM